MKTLLSPLVFAFVLLFNNSFAQSTGRYLMKFYDHHYTLAVNKNGQLANMGNPDFTHLTPLLTALRQLTRIVNLFCVIFTQNLEIPDSRYKFAYK